MSTRTKKWIKAAGIRALKTFCQGLATMIGAQQVNIISLDWPTMLGMAATMAVVSLLTSAAGIPEVDMESDGDEDE
jgi:hypothetical protein